jgi:hypothetical protein
MKDWNSVQKEFEADGSLRDLLVFDTSEDIWNSLICAVSNSSYLSTFRHSDSVVQLPQTFAEIKTLQELDPTILSIDIGNRIKLNCHFFVSVEIELDFDPKEMNNEEDYSCLVGFISWLHAITKRSVIVTHEGAPEMEILKIG